MTSIVKVLRSIIKSLSQTSSTSPFEELVVSVPTLGTWGAFDSSVCYRFSVSVGKAPAIE